MTLVVPGEGGHRSYRAHGFEVQGEAQTSQTGEVRGPMRSIRGVGAGGQGVGTDRVWGPSSGKWAVLLRLERPLGEASR